jgi:hypothetical protein
MTVSRAALPILAGALPLCIGRLCVRVEDWPLFDPDGERLMG